MGEPPGGAVCYKCSMRARSLRAAIGAGLAVALAGGAARAVDPFEIQVYDGTADDRGVAGLELHVNNAVNGLRSAPPPELPAHHVTHLTLEPSYGVFAFWELGGYLQTALRPDGAFDFAGVKLRSKLVTPPGWAARARLGVNLEVSYISAAYEPARWGGEVRPIAAWESERLLLAVNPILGMPVAGQPLGFEPAATALFKVPRVLSAGLEYYADIGALTHPARVAAQEHYLYEVVNVLRFPRWELNLGVGEGLTASSQPVVAKFILGYLLN
jgi:hypothetical protein